MFRRDYVFKVVEAVEIAATAFWKPHDSADTPYGIGMRSYLYGAQYANHTTDTLSSTGIPWRRLRYRLQIFYT